MGNCCRNIKLLDKTSIEYEEYDNYIPMIFGPDYMNSNFNDKLFSLRKSMSISVKILYY